MKKSLKKLLVCLLVVAMFPIRAFAAEEEAELEIVEMTEAEAEFYWNLYRTEAGISPLSDFSDTDLGIFQSDGKLMVLYSTSCSELASEIGTKQIILEVKDGLFWSAVATKEKAYTTNAYTHTGGFYYTKPVSGSNYRVSGIHYAVIDGKEITSYANTGSFTYN